MSHNIPCSWQVPYLDSEIKHQLEPGEPRPTHTYEGWIVAFVKDYIVARSSGLLTTVTEAIIRQKKTGKLWVLPVTSVKTWWANGEEETLRQRLPEEYRENPSQVEDAYRGRHS